MPSVVLLVRRDLDLMARCLGRFLLLEDLGFGVTDLSVPCFLGHGLLTWLSKECSEKSNYLLSEHSTITVKPSFKTKKDVFFKMKGFSVFSFIAVSAFLLPTTISAGPQWAYTLASYECDQLRKGTPKDKITAMSHNRFLSITGT